jgi:hypothetical protein
MGAATIAWKTTRIAMTMRPSLRKTLKDLAQGDGLRRADTTYAATATMRSSRIGLVVRDAATASPAAHSHQAPG